MLNQTVIVGRLVRDPELYETENGNKVTNITLAVPRSYKNVNGEYDTDFVPCVLWKGVAENTVEYCRKGDLLGVKGHVQTRDIEVDEDVKRKLVEIVEIKNHPYFIATQFHPEFKSRPDKPHPLCC